MGTINERIFFIIDGNADLSDTKMAKFIGCSKSTVSRWRKGDITPHIKYTGLIAKYLGVSESFLLNGTEEENKAIFFSEEEIALIMSYRNLKTDMKKFVFNAVANNATPITQHKEVEKRVENERRQGRELIKELQAQNAPSELAK